MKTTLPRGLVRIVLALGIVTGGLLSSVQAQSPTTITVDENGNGIGTVGPGALAPDPFPGGLPSVLTYQLPFTVIAGDVLLGGGASDAGAINDVLRFNTPPNGGPSTLLFYSDNVPVADALGDTPSAPLAFYPNNTEIPEVGDEGNNGAFYTPTEGQPGFFPGVTYHFISDGTAVVTTPEAGASVLLLGLGLAGLLTFRRFGR